MDSTRSCSWESCAGSPGESVAVKTKPWALTGAILFGVAVAGSAVLVRNEPEVDRPAAQASAPPSLLWERPRPAGDDFEEFIVAADPKPDVPEAAGGVSPYGTVLIKSTPTRRHWRVDPREVQAVNELRDASFPGLVLSAHFGGGVRVENPSDLRLGVVRDLERGDVVREINDIPVRDETQFRLLASRLWKKTGVIRAEVDRAGSSVTITYQRADAPLPPARFR